MGVCYQELASKYNDIVATDALHKLFAFEAAKKFTPSKVHTWISAVENSWAQVVHTYTQGRLYTIGIRVMPCTVDTRWCRCCLQAHLDSVRA